MPIYGYRCKSCNHSFEVIQSINDEPIKECPECGNEVNKVFFPVGIAFKGSGFHVNDYKSPKRTASEKATGSSDSSSNGGSESGSGCTGCTSAGTCGAE